MRKLKKSKYKSVTIKKKRYYFYKITWLDITGDSGHADLKNLIMTVDQDLLMICIKKTLIEFSILHLQKICLM